MKLSSHPLVKAELDALEIQFGTKAYLTLDDYAELYGIDRRFASRHVKRRGIPSMREGRGIYISTLDLAIYKVKCKGGLVEAKSNQEEMKRRRGFSQAAERKHLTK